jgi:hypothetical protein
MIRTAFALLALATLAKNDASGRFRLADACTAIVRAFTDNVAESHSQRFAPMMSVCPSQDALAMSGIGPHLFRDVLRAYGLRTLFVYNAEEICFSTKTCRRLVWAPRPCNVNHRTPLQGQ